MNRIALSIAALAAVMTAPLGASAHAASFIASQSAGEHSTFSLIGLKVENAAGDNLGDVNYLVIDGSGKVTTVVVGVGGFLGVAEKNVAVPFSEVSLTTNKDGKDIAKLDATKENLTAAPAYVWTEKSTTQLLKEEAKDLAKRAQEGASSLAEKAKKAADDMKTPETK
jgi:sporulation protein YlmC with PRC-barrel domain